MSHPRNLSQAGVILPTFVLIMLGLTITAIAIADYAVNALIRTDASVSEANALLVAEAGAEQSLYELNEDSNFSGYASEVEFYSNGIQGRATYETTVTNGSIANEKVIVSIGRVYLPATDSTPRDIRRVQLLVNGTSTSSNYAVHAGAGGLEMTGSATIANGPVYVNGGIEMTGASRIGSSSVPVNVFAANYRCPTSAPYTNYPELCDSSAGEPITANIWSNRIYGNVCATGQTTGSYMYSNGLQSGCVASPAPLPAHDRNAITTSTNSTQSSSQARCNGVTTKSWPANLHITGDADVGASCTLTITGDVWIDGDLTINGAARVLIDESLTEPPEIIVDGSGGVNLSGSGRIIPNSNNVAALIVTYYSDAACSPGCSDVTGADLATSTDHVTVDISGAGQAPGTLFYARWSKADLRGSGSTGGAIGQKVRITGAGNVVFGTQLSSGASTWSIQNYQQIFD